MTLLQYEKSVAVVVTRRQAAVLYLGVSDLEDERSRLDLTRKPSSGEQEFVLSGPLA